MVVDEVVVEEVVVEKGWCGMTNHKLYGKDHVYFHEKIEAL